MLSFSDLNATVAASKVCKCLPSRWERGAGYRMQRTMGGQLQGATWGTTLTKSVNQFRDSFYQQPYHQYPCLHQERNRQECRGLIVFSYMLLIWEKNTSPTLLPGSFSLTDTLFANHKLLTNMGALHLVCRDVSLFENKTNKAK